jgi:hypothetical protein
MNTNNNLKSYENLQQNMTNYLNKTLEKGLNIVNKDTKIDDFNKNVRLDGILEKIQKSADIKGIKQRKELIKSPTPTANDPVIKNGKTQSIGIKFSPHLWG